MEAQITLHDKQFKPYIGAARIHEKVKAMGEAISADYQGKCPLFIGVLTGSFMFATDLMKHISIDCEIAFVRLSSYQGTESTGTVSELMGLSETVEGRDVIIVEDIVDTGNTLAAYLPRIQGEKPSSVSIASLFVKPEALQHPLEIKYRCFDIPNDFIVGYGLDYDGLGRNLPDVYQVAG